MSQQYPLVGTAVWIRKDGMILLGQRAKEKKAGPGTWCPPGGHLDMFETVEQCAIRETREEASIKIKNVTLIAIEEDWQREEGIHYVTFHYQADWASGDPKPQMGESENWKWFAWGSLPEPLFQPARIFVEKGYNPLKI